MWTWLVKRSKAYKSLEKKQDDHLRRVTELLHDIQALRGRLGLTAKVSTELKYSHIEQLEEVLWGGDSSSSVGNFDGVKNQFKEEK